MILGQVFDDNREYYDFGGQDVTKRYASIHIFLKFNCIHNSDNNPNKIVYVTEYKL